MCEYQALTNWEAPHFLANFLNNKTVLPAWCFVLKWNLDPSHTLLCSAISQSHCWSVVCKILVVFITLRCFCLLGQPLRAATPQIAQFAAELQQNDLCCYCWSVFCFLRCGWKSDLHLGVISHLSPRQMAVNPPCAAYRGASRATLCAPPHCSSRTAPPCCLHWVNSAHNPRLNVKYFLQGK